MAVLFGLLLIVSYKLYYINNPATIGNPDLKPETIDTLELAVNFKPHQRLAGTVALYAYEADNLISGLPSAVGVEFHNVDSQHR